MSKVIGEIEISSSTLAVDTQTAARMLGIAPGTLQNYRYGRTDKTGPKYARIGRKIVYPIAELEAYLAESIVDKGADE